jgi:DNA-binding XRE family transcriptional regulator
MANRQSTPEIRAEAFTAAREKCAMSVEELAHLACLSKKQIQQIENGQSTSFYSPTVKFTAAKKVAKLIQLDEKDAFDFGPQAELPFAQAADVIQSELTAVHQDSTVNAEKEAPPKEAAQADEGEPKETKKKAVVRKRKADAESPVVSEPEAKPILVEAVKPEPGVRMHFGGREQKSAGKKWVWLLPVGALVLAIVQFQPVLRDQLDAMMGKSKPVEVIALPSAPPADPAPSNPPATEANVAPAPAVPATAAPAAPAPASPVVASSPPPVTAASGCPSADGAMESYKPASAGKPGNLVFVKASTAQLVCVIDAGGVVQSKALEPGLGHSFYGKPPFKVLTPGFSSVEVFFQGFRVRPGAPDAKNILLVQAD